MAVPVQAAASVMQTLQEEELGQDDMYSRFLSEYPGPEHSSVPAVVGKTGGSQLALPQLVGL